MELNPLLYRHLVEQEIRNDLGNRGDITSEYLFSAEHNSRITLRSRAKGVLSGLEAALYAFSVLDPDIRVARKKKDGDSLESGSVLATIEGKTRSLLSAERTALNLLGHLSGIASKTSTMVQATEGTRARILDTRKTLPGLRGLQKYAVRCGGGKNHRFGLHDAVMIKDNHLEAVDSLPEAISRIRQSLGHTVKLEVEVDTLQWLEEVISLDIDIVLLDNMGPETLRKAVSIVDGRAITEASGNVDVEKVREIAMTGVDYISSGALTHSAENLDIGADHE